MSLAADVAELERGVQRALGSGDDSHLKVLGYGEISTVLLLETAAGSYAAKRLPPFSDAERVDSYRQILERYIEGLAQRGVQAVSTELVSVPSDEQQVAYVLQPALSPDELLPNALRRLSPDEMRSLFGRLVERIYATIEPRFGLDAQISNWVLSGETLRYLDISTPLMRDAAGNELLDTDLFLASLPWAIRGPVKRFLLGSILDKYYDARAATLDVAGNLIKEGQSDLLAAFLKAANTQAEPALSEAEVRSYYSDDARTWALLQRLRQLDRAWQRRVRRRPYPFLLPGNIERRA